MPKYSRAAARPDLRGKRPLEDAFRGWYPLFHAMASPVPLVNPTSDEELVGPVGDGTLRVFKAARHARLKFVSR